MGSELLTHWRNLGIKSGDVLLLHSSASRLIRSLKKQGHDKPLDVILDSLSEAVGDNGTVLFPSFNFDFTKGVPFDIRNTPGQMGIISEAARTASNSTRTGHPIYSFIARGAHAESLRQVQNSSGYGSDSPFAFIHKMNGKIAVLDLPDQHSMTFYHYVEEALRVEYRYHKWFHGQFTGWDGVEQRRSFSLFVRDLERGVLTDVNGMGEILWQEGLYRGDRPGTGFGVRAIESARLFDAVSDVIRSGRAKGLLYSTTPT